MKNVKILAVDDEEHFLELLLRTLGKEGYEVRTAVDGREALRWLKREEFEVALVDLRMTPIDGLAVLENIKKRYPSIKVIMLTAYPSVETRTLSFQRGAERYLIKPIEIQELKQAIRETLSQLDKGHPKD